MTTQVFGWEEAEVLVAPTYQNRDQSGGEIVWQKAPFGHMHFSGMSVGCRFLTLRREVGAEGTRAWESLAHTLGLK